MKSSKFLAISALGVCMSFKSGDILSELGIGSFVPMISHKMKDVSGNEYTFRDIKKNKGLLVIFSCNTCPFVIAAQERYRKIGELCGNSEIGIAVVNSNEAYRTNGADSFDEMKSYAEKQRYRWPYLVDSHSEVADAFGATRTPHVFLFDKDLRLVYRGAIDDNAKDESAVNDRFLAKAIENMLAGKEISPNATVAIGCSIKRAER